MSIKCKYSTNKKNNKEYIVKCECGEIILKTNLLYIAEIVTDKYSNFNIND